MAKANLADTLKRRMSAAQQASEMEIGASAYEQLFSVSKPTMRSNICDLPMDKLVPFFTADIGFKPYPPEKLSAFARQLTVDGQLERIIVRPIPDTDKYEILAGHNRTAAGKLNDWATMAAEIVEADDDRAITIATATNLLRRQDLTIIERGKAYKALLEAKNRNGQRNALGDGETFGDNRQRYNARTIVAEFFGVTEYEIRKAVKLTQLIPPLANLLEQGSKSLSLACAEIIADYAPQEQEAFTEMCSIDGYRLNKATVKFISNRCPPLSADKKAIYNAWREAKAAENRRLAAPPKTIQFNRKLFQPYLEKLGSEKELEKLFLEFLKEKVT